MNKPQPSSIPPGSVPPTKPPLAKARELHRSMSGESDQVPTMGRIVIFSDRHTLDASPCPAMVTSVRTEGPRAILALTTFPAGAQPFPVDGVVHVSEAGDHDRCWAWPARA